MYPLTDSDREILKTLVGMALENRFSALRELTDETREQLYVVFAKLTDDLDSESQPESSQPSEEAPDSEAEPKSRRWAARDPFLRGSKPD